MPSVVGVMRWIRTALPLLLVCLAIPPRSGAAISRTLVRQPSPVVKLHFHTVSRGLTTVGPDAVLAASDRFLALETVHHSVALLRTSTNRETALSPPDCPTTENVDFGGPWLAVGCLITTSASTPDVHDVDLLDLTTGTWTIRELDPEFCHNDIRGCEFTNVGRTWVRFSTNTDSFADPAPTYLQNISTGEVKNDLNSLGTLTISPNDNLNNASGVSHPCVALAPALDQDFLGTPVAGAESDQPVFAQLGHFVLRTSSNIFEPADASAVLHPCESRVRIVLPEPLAASSDMILGPQHGTNPSEQQISGLTLPGLQSFVLDGLAHHFAALSDTTIYETGYDKARDAAVLLAATIPSNG